MLKNYFRTAFNHLLNQKAFTLINLSGLTIGLMVCFISILYIAFELSYDRYHSKSDRTFRLVTDVKTSHGTEYKGTSAPMVPAIAERFPEVESATRIALDYYLVQNEGEPETAYEEKIAYADSSLFSVFDFQLISGNIRTALRDPFSVILSESFAKKYFGNADPINKGMILDGSIRVTVTGVMSDIPENSHFKADMLVSLSTLIESWWSREMANNWTRFIFHSYIVLPENYKPGQLEEKLVTLADLHFDQENFQYKLILEPLTDIYLHGAARSYRSGTILTGNINNLYFFGLVAAFVLFAACFNFANLTAAISIKRTREVGVRKVLGATRTQIRLQFLFDSVILSFISLLIALALTFLLLPSFNQFIGISIGTSAENYLIYMGIIVLVAGFAGVISGLYPAIVLSGREVRSALKGGLASSKTMSLKRMLVVAQFIISFFLIASTIVVFTQLNFMRNKALGFSVVQKLAIDFHFDPEIQKNLAFIKHELTSLDGVSLVSLSSCVPGKPSHVRATFLENGEGAMQDLQMDSYYIDFNFLDQYNIEIVAGRKFSEAFPYDRTESMIINETALRALGYSNAEAAIGKAFSQGDTDGRIVGVVKDFHYNSLREEIRPLSFRCAKIFTFMTLTISNQAIQQTIQNIEKKWPTLGAKVPLSYFFIDKEFDRLYSNEEQFGKLFACVALLAIIISSMGLLALSAYTIARRAREISIRKVFGADVSTIILLLGKHFLSLITIALVIGTPLAWYSSQKWLSNFPYRMSLSLWIFITAAASVIALAVLIVGLQTLRAATVNPVRSLKAD